jgi:hypothetical protein
MAQSCNVSTRYFGNRAETFSRVGGEGAGLAGGEDNGFITCLGLKIPKRAFSTNNLGKKITHKEAGLTRCVV